MDYHQNKYAEGVTEISPVLVRWWPCASTYAGKTSHKIIPLLLAERGEGRGEESKSSLFRDALKQICGRNELLVKEVNVVK